MNDLLPINATPQERAMALAAARISAVPVPVRDVWNPDRCPPELLPWLAWAVSVENWKNTWTSTQKRQVIKDSLFVHQHKGTIGAVKRAIASLGYSVEITEWFDMEPAGAPYTFRADVSTGDTDVSAETYNALVRLIDDAKNVRSHLATLGIVTEIDCALYFACFTQSGLTSEITP